MIQVILLSGETVNISNMLTCDGHILSLKTDKGFTVLLSDIAEVI